MRLPNRVTDIKVGSKTPGEIKKGLECIGGLHEPCIPGCPYEKCCECGLTAARDAIELIQQLETIIAQVERERDAAVADLESVDEKYETLKSMIDDVTFNHEPYSLYLDFRAAADAIVEHEHADVWRGVCEEKTKEE